MIDFNRIADKGIKIIGSKEIKIIGSKEPLMIKIIIKDLMIIKEKIILEI